MRNKKLLLLIVLFFSQLLVGQQKNYQLSEVATVPEFPGGQELMRSFINSNFELPEDTNVSGQLEISFIVDPKGKLSNFEIVKDLGGGTAAEAIRIFSSSPRWKPGKLADGTAVSVRYTLPIKLESK